MMAIPIISDGADSLAKTSMITVWLIPSNFGIDKIIATKSAKYFERGADNKDSSITKYSFGAVATWLSRVSKEMTKNG